MPSLFFYTKPNHIRCTYNLRLGMKLKTELIFWNWYNCIQHSYISFCISKVFHYVGAMSLFCQTTIIIWIQDYTSNSYSMLMFIVSYSIWLSPTLYCTTVYSVFTIKLFKNASPFTSSIYYMSYTLKQKNWFSTKNKTNLLKSYQTISHFFNFCSNIFIHQ